MPEPERTRLHNKLVAVRLPQEIEEELKREAKKRRLSISEIMRMILQEFVRPGTVKF